MPLLLITLLAVSAASAATSAIDAEAAQLIKLTKQTKTTYSAFNWNVITPPDGDLIEEWGAEFHSGSLHRVETPNVRVIADCATMTGTYLDLASGKIDSGTQYAKIACGIADHLGITSAKLLPSANGRFGWVKRLVVEDGRTVRTYSVDAQGIIVEEQIASPDGHVSLVMHVVTVKKVVPTGIFTVASLQRSAVSARFKLRPRL
jgi:hypothetical protein